MFDRSLVSQSAVPAARSVSIEARSTRFCKAVQMKGV